MEEEESIREKKGAEKEDFVSLSSSYLSCFIFLLFTLLFFLLFFRYAIYPMCSLTLIISELLVSGILDHAVLSAQPAGTTPSPRGHQKSQKKRYKRDHFRLLGFHGSRRRKHKYF